MTDSPNDGTPRPESGGFLPPIVEHAGSDAWERARQQITTSMSVHVIALRRTIDEMTDVLASQEKEAVIALVRTFSFSADEVSKRLGIAKNEVDEILEFDEGPTQRD